MKFNRIALIGILLLVILMLGGVNAADDMSDHDDFVLSSQNGDISSNEDNAEIISQVEDIESDENSVISLSPAKIDVEVVDESRVDVNIANATGNVVVIVDDDENSIPLNDYGSASVGLKNLSAGEHSLVVIFEGDKTYAPTHSVSVFTIKGMAPLSSEFGDIVIDEAGISIILKDENGKDIANAPILCSVNGIATTKTTDVKGALVIEGKNGDKIDISYAGSDEILGTNKTIVLNVASAPSVVKVTTKFDVPGGVVTINGYAVDVNAGEEGIYYSTRLLDDKNNPLKSKDIQFAVNNKIYNRTTYDDGSFDPYKLNMIRAGRYTMAFYYSGDDKYEGAFACVCVDLAKKPIKIKASAKSYKVSAKSKKYTVTLSTIAGSSHNGKVYLSPKKVTLKVNGMTYTGNTNKNGQVTFNLKLTKKGKYSAVVKFAGDNTYESATKNVKITLK